MKLQNYLQDGADSQSRAVIQFVNPHIEDSWDDARKMYRSIIEVGRWENCREQGYILSMVDKYNVQYNIIVFQHRNSDNICAIDWVQNSMNSISIDTIKDGVFEDKFKSIKHEEHYGEVLPMAQWINNQFNEFWNKD